MNIEYEKEGYGTVLILENDGKILRVHLNAEESEELYDAVVELHEKDNPPELDWP